MGATDLALEDRHNEHDEIHAGTDGGSELRDSAKSNKFDVLLGKGLIPTHIVDMLTERCKESKDARGFKTKLINSLFEREDKGKLVMVSHAPFFTEWKQTHDTRNMSHTEKALPKTMFC